MNKYKAIIVDDEERARRFFSNMITTYVDDAVEVVATCANVPEAVIAINKFQPDVVFLDIEMPDYNGFELLQFFKKIDFEIIFVTAYSEYAIKAFEISALDYILKPVESDALIHAISKLKEKKTLHNVSQRLALLKESYQSDEFSKIALPVSDGLLFVEVKNIVCVEASGSYTNVWLEDGSKILVSKKILFFEKVLSSKRTFFRVHRSYIVNFNFVQKYNKAESCLNMDNNIVIPIPKEKKSEIENILKDIRIG